MFPGLFRMFVSRLRMIEMLRNHLKLLLSSGQSLQEPRPHGCKDILVQTLLVSLKITRKH